MSSVTAESKKSFFETLQVQRWDDHRYYHHSRINQTLHLISACSFLSAYVLIFIDPIWAVMMGWFVAMITRQIGHFFFEPKGYDQINRATHEHKEEIKVGYNLQRKVWLLSVWAAIPVVLWLDPTFFGLFDPHADLHGYAHNLSVLWLVLGGIAVVLRTAFLCLTRDMQTGLVWATKILTDPFHDVKIYHRAPLYLLRGEMLDPMTDWPEPTRRL